MSIRDAVAQGKIRYNLDLDTLEAIHGEFDMWDAVDFSNLTLDDIQFLKANFNTDLIDRIMDASNIK